MTEPPTRNIKLVIAYDGSKYHGWQRQREGIDTVQLRIEEAAGSVLKHPVTVHGAGRTDTGVHAEGQVANLHTTNLRVPLSGLRRAMNSRLPGDIAIRSANRVPDDFHASLSAIGKTYQYRVCVCPTRPASQSKQVYHYWKPLEIEPMRRGGRKLLGRHDFAALASAGDLRDNTVRTLFRCDVAEAGDRVTFTVEGDGFLYHMVRNIAGTLIEIGRGRWTPGQIDRLLSSRNRADSGPTAPPDGLTMVCVHYRPEDLHLR
jgi:tRNA pseudouridine38-40 synthase